MKLEASDMQQVNLEGGQDEIALAMVLEQMKMSDKLFSEFGIDEEVFNQLMFYHKLYDDKEVQEELARNLQKMPSDPFETIINRD